MLLKRTIAACIVSSMLLMNTQVVSAEEVNIEINEDTINSALISVESLNDQIESLYDSISDNVGIGKEYIRQLHLLSGGQAIYADKKPCIYNDITSEVLQEPINLYNAQTIYQEAHFIECGDDKIERPSAYYLPDALYSVSYDIYALMTQRYYRNRDGMQIYFDSLKDDTKEDIVFYEALMLYTGEKEEVVDNLFKAYEKILYDKQKNENVIEKTDSGKYIIKDKFLDIVMDIGITDETRLDYLATVLSLDENLMINDSVENLKDSYIVPYRLNYTSRENMMLAAMCLTGKVRYIWAGGHSGASYIDGINPVWGKWNDLYPSEPYTTIMNEETGEESVVSNVGFGTCIKTSGSWCPIHGYSSDDCSDSELIYSLDQYISMRSETFDTTELMEDKYSELLSKVDYSDGISVHTLDGLDCSGFASWLYNQITDRYEINSTAMYFTEQNGIKEVKFGSELLPGDIFTWTNHIVIVIGKVRDNSKAYVTIEETPNVLKFGVIYYSGAKQSDIDYGKQVAIEANELLGGLDSTYEEPHVYCMNNVGHYTEDILDDETDEVIDTIEGQYRAIGRFKNQFIDEGILIGDDNIPIEKMTAEQIIQHTLTKLPISYVSGYNLYDGALFNKNLVSSNLGITLVEN